MSSFQSYHTALFQIQERRAGEVRGRVREEVPDRAVDQDLRPHAQDVQEAPGQEVRRLPGVGEECQPSSI